MIPAFVQAIANACELIITGCERVHGGDINESYCVYNSASKYFLKLNDSNRFPSMFEKEADGLRALRTKNIMLPAVIKQGITENKQWLLLEWIDKGAPNKNTMQQFGTALAGMHKQPQPLFGWQADNYIGSLQQLNTQYNSWKEFYTRCRILPLVKHMYGKKIFLKDDIYCANALCSKLHNIFPEEPAALLHGDLWSGNYLINTKAQAVIFDPAIYCGHREMDLGMTILFGGFDQSFYDAYHDCYPLEKGWQQRMELTQLYPLLVHAILFGGNYIASARSILRKFQ